MIAGVRIDRGAMLLAITVVVLAFALVRLLTDNAGPRLTPVAAEAAPAAADSAAGDPLSAEPTGGDDFAPLRRAAFEVIAGTAAVALLLIGLVWQKGRRSY